MTIIDALEDQELFGRFFSGASWGAWKVLLKSVFGLSLTEEELETWKRHTEREEPPTERAREAWLMVGRRGGKSRIAALVAVYVACFGDYSKVLAPGERGVVMLLAADRRQARVLLRYVVGLLDSSSVLSSMVEERLKETVRLTNRIDIEIHTSNFRSVRGYSIVACIPDEIAFWRNEDSANPDVEVINAIRPGMASVPGSLLLPISSPYSRRGALWQAYCSHFGKDGDPVLFWQADTQSMNPMIPEHVIAEAYEADPASAAAEWGAEFRRDIESFVPVEAVEACIVPGRYQLPPDTNKFYFAFVDPSGGSRDSFTLAVGHQEEEKTVLDLVVERKPPFSPEEVVGQFCDTLKLYRVSRVTGDHYAGDWPREQFRKRGVSYELSEHPKSDIYRDLLPLLTSGKVELLDNVRLKKQLVDLERKTARSGKDSIDHSPGAHDDVINAAAGAVTLAAARIPTISYRELLWG